MSTQFKWSPPLVLTYLVVLSTLQAAERTGGLGRDEFSTADLGDAHTAWS
jgi:hypothetical protein